MTEGEWRECADPKAMMESLRGKAFPRKLRLFACACCRRIWNLMTDARGREPIRVAERFADGFAPREGLAAVRAALEAAKGLNRDRSRLAQPQDWVGSAELIAYQEDFFDPLYYSVHVGIGLIVGWAALDGLGPPRPDPQEFASLAVILRDIIGNPFRPVSFDPAWLTPTVLDLAQAAYDERILPSGELDAARLAVLSDCLEESGCDDQDILNHLRSPGSHVRGCWALDLISGKS